MLDAKQVASQMAKFESEISKATSEVTRYSSEFEAHEKEHAALAGEARKIQALSRLAHLQSKIRGIASTMSVPGFLLVCAAAPGALGLMLGFGILSSGLAAGFIAISFAAVGLATGIGVLFQPRDVDDVIVALQSRQQRISEQLSQVDRRMDALREPLRTKAERLQRLQAEYQSLTQSRAAQLAALASRNWKAMRGEDLEFFLKEVFTALGYQAETTKKTGDQGVDLVLCKGGYRIAVQVKGYVNSVGLDAVQQAVAGKAIYGCAYSAVVTNSLFTPSAKELASANRCVLIDEHALPRIILGQEDVLTLCMGGGRGQANAAG